MRAIIDYISRSTLKREVAVLLMFWWAAIGSILLLQTPTAQLVPGAALVAWGALTVPVLGYAAAAFTQDWISKQTTIAGPPSNTEIKTETVVTEDGATSITSSSPTDQEVKQ